MGVLDMTVGELIKKLKEFPESSEIVGYNGEKLPEASFRLDYIEDIYEIKRTVVFSPYTVDEEAIVKYNSI